METQNSKLFISAVHTLVCLFGMASWLSNSGVMLQLPIMVNYLPEGWALGSYITLINQLASFGVIVFCIPQCFTSKRFEIVTNYVFFSVEILACIMLALFWDRTSGTTEGEEHSTALLIICFFMALGNKTSNLSFLAFMTLFPNVYMGSYFVGDALNNFVPSVLALLQGAGGNPECRNMTIVSSTVIGNVSINTTYHETEYYYPTPRYPVELYFIVIGILLCVSLLSHSMLAHMPIIAKIHLRDDENSKPKHTKSIRWSSSTEITTETSNLYASQSKPKHYGTDNTLYKNKEKTENKVMQNENADPIDSSLENEDAPTEDQPLLKKSRSVSLCRRDWIYLLTMHGWSCAMTYSVMPSIQAYSTLPYGNATYHFAVTLGLVTMPTASLCVHWLPAKSNVSIGVFSTLATLVASYIIYIGLTSPNPPLCGSMWGPILSVTSWILFYFLFTYVRVSVGVLFREEGHTALLWYGGVLIIASFLGAVVTFPMVNVLHLFQSNDPCEFTCY
ncbi:riboflavin transporter 2-like [Glandiceps talaboti]